MLTTQDLAARNLAECFQALDDTQAAWDLAYLLAEKLQCNFVLCITSDGQNLSKSFPVTEYRSDDVEQYFQCDCPAASECQFKLHIWA